MAGIPPEIRVFESGANRSSEEGKLDFDGFLSPLVLERFGEYMHKHRHLPNGELRDSDNWQRGIPLSAYLKSAWRHFLDWWSLHRLPGCKVHDNYSMEDTLCALLFNVSGYLHEVLQERKYRL